MKREIIEWAIDELLSDEQPLYLRIKYWLKLNDLLTPSHKDKKKV
jgi:hypothetical protein